MTLSGWRRDVVAALVGIGIAAGVLVPIGWSLVLAERERADAAEREREEARQEADRSAAKIREMYDIRRELITNQIEAARDMTKALDEAEARGK